MKAFKGNFPTFSPNWKGPKHIYCWLFHNLNPFAFGFPGLSPTGVAATSPIWWPGDSSSLLFTPVSKIYSFQIRWYNFKVNHPTMTYSGLVPDTFIKLFKFKHSVHYRQPMTSTNLGSDEAGHSSLSPGANTPPRNSREGQIQLYSLQLLVIQRWPSQLLSAGGHRKSSQTKIPNQNPNKTEDSIEKKD